MNKIFKKSSVFALVFSALFCGVSVWGQATGQEDAGEEIFEFDEMPSDSGKKLQFVPLKSAVFIGADKLNDGTVIDGRPIGGTPPESSRSQITLGVLGTDVDNFTSAANTGSVGYKSSFGYFGFDMNSLSLGVSKKFLGAVTSLYYNGNIAEDMFAYISNSPNAGNVAIASKQTALGPEFDALGDWLNGREEMDSRTNINALFGIGTLGVNVGYSQRLTGYVRESNASEVERVEAGSGDDGLIRKGMEAEVINSIAPSVEFGLQFGKPEKVLIRLSLGGRIYIRTDCLIRAVILFLQIILLLVAGLLIAKMKMLPKKLFPTIWNLLFWSEQSLNFLQMQNQDLLLV
jgi:hypothetical protein